MSQQVPSAPISSPVSSANYQLWFEKVGRFANSATTSKYSRAPDGNKINYVQNGATLLLNYTGKGGFTADLPVKCKYRAILPVSDNTTILLEADATKIVLPEYKTEVTVHGAYITA